MNPSEFSKALHQVLSDIDAEKYDKALHTISVLISISENLKMDSKQRFKLQEYLLETQDHIVNHKGSVADLHRALSRAQVIVNTHMT